jgi:hypothetical protein
MGVDDVSEARQQVDEGELSTGELAAVVDIDDPKPRGRAPSGRVEVPMGTDHLLP